MSERARRWPEARTVLLWAAAGLLEAPCVLLAAGWPSAVPPAWGAAAHAGAAALVFLAPPKERGWLKPTRHWGEALGLLTLLLPGLGWAVSGWLLALHQDAPLDKDAYRFEDDASDGPEPSAGAGTAESLRRELAEALDVLPAVDALLGSSPELKRGAIETLGRIRSREAVAWIGRARSSRDPEVRFYATTALTRLKRDFETAINAAQKESWRRPGDLAAQLALQRARYEHAVSGVLEADAAAAVLAECRERLGPLAERGPEALRLLFLVTRRLEPEQALSLLPRLESADPGRARWLRERAELLFELGRHRELRALLRGRRAEILAGKVTEEREWRSAALWWTDG